MNKNETNNTQSSGRKAMAEILDYFEVIVIAICVVFFLFIFVCRTCRVSGGSMENTLYDGETLIISNLFYTPDNGDIIVFHQTGTLNEPVVKRVIATAGQWVQVTCGENPEDMKVYVSNDAVIDEGDLVNESYFNDDFKYLSFNGNNFDFEAAQVPEGYIFVMGDHRYHSTDSRSPLVGFVDTRRILGKVLLRISPMDKFGAVE